MTSRLFTKIAIVLGFALLAACSQSGDKAGGADWSKAQTHKVTTPNGDRVTARVRGDAKTGYEYEARIRRLFRANADNQDRQRVLDDAAQVLMSQLCGAGYKQERPYYVANYFGQHGRFVCAGS